MAPKVQQKTTVPFIQMPSRLSTFSSGLVSKGPPNDLSKLLGSSHRLKSGWRRQLLRCEFEGRRPRIFGRRRARELLDALSPGRKSALHFRSKYRLNQATSFRFPIQRCQA
jgi:hypothetical protein